MFVIEIREYDYFAGYTVKQIEESVPEVAKIRYETEKRKDFDYGDHYRTTSIFEIKEG